MKVFLFLVLNCFALMPLVALDFPGQSPGKATVKLNDAANEYTLSNNIISVSYYLKDNMIYLKRVVNKIDGSSFDQKSSPVFQIKAGQPVSDWEVIKKPEISVIQPLKKSSSKGKLFSGKAVMVVLKSKETGITVVLSSELRDQSNYIRSIITLSSEKSITIDHISMNCNLNLPGAMQKSRLTGQPVFAGHFFFGVEEPFSRNSIRRDVVTQGFGCKLSLKPGLDAPFASVIGVFPEKQLRRALLYYIDRERARSYSPFLLYNCWFDLARRVSEPLMMDRIKKIQSELTEKRGVQVVSYVVDDGYDDYHKGFWAFNSKKFPNGFKNLAEYLLKTGSHLGLWLSPAGGYVGNKERRERAKEIGIDSLDLSTPAYYKWFLERHMRFIKEEQVNFFKWDKLGGGVSGHFMALMDIASKLRKENPELFLATTVGTWPSMFWLNHVDCTWRAGGDMGFTGKGGMREQWLTYRDGITYKKMKESAFLYPLTAMMNHGVVFANGHSFAKKALKGTKDLRHETRSYFGGGYGMQELYITPDILKDEQWNAIADAAKWAHSRSNILVDSHFIGGEPLKLETYGFAAWNNNHGTVTLRNPSDQPAVFTLDVEKAFELPSGAIRKYKLTSPYPDQRIKSLTAEAGVPIEIKMEPFEVFVFDASPEK